MSEAIDNVSLVEIVTSGLGGCRALVSRCARSHDSHMAVSRVVFPHHDSEFALIRSVLRLLRRARVKTKLCDAMTSHPNYSAVDVNFTGMRRVRCRYVARTVNPVRNFSAHGTTDVLRKDIAVSVAMVGQVTGIISHGELIDQL